MLMGYMMESLFVATFAFAKFVIMKTKSESKVNAMKTQR